MSLSLKNYFKFGWRKFLIPMLKDGIYRFESFDDNDTRIMATTFYIDGDVFTELYTENDQLLVDVNEDKVEKHLQSVEEKVGSMDVLFAQIQAFITLISTALTYLFATKEFGPGIGAAAFFGVGTIVLLLRKYFLKGAIWLIKKVVIPLIQRY